MNRREKLRKLADIILAQERMTVALSGGVDSVFLLGFARDVYLEAGRGDSLAALTAVGAQFAADETDLATELCDRLGIAHKKVDVSHIVNMIKRNPEDRCYQCKRELFWVLKDYAERTMSVLTDGTNVDDMDDYRPGYRAIQELGVLSPLKEAGLSKEEIRESLRELAIGDGLGLGDASNLGELVEIWQKPAFACLATRIPYGETISEAKLSAIYGAESFLKKCGFTQVRVRCHEIAGKISGSAARFMARIELLPSEMSGLFEAASTGSAEFVESVASAEFVKNMESAERVKGAASAEYEKDTASANTEEAPLREPAGKPCGESILNKIEDELKALGFEYVTLDLGGYEKGKMNSALQGEKIPREGGEASLAVSDRIRVTETVVRGNAENVETRDVMAEIDRFLRETREKSYSFEDFAEVIEKLRMPDGCPWDREQTHESLKKHMVEEVNEALDAIDEKDWNHLCEELGDVLLQIVLHAQIAKEAGEFGIDDVIQCVSEKMIRRHPHVFGDIDVSNVDEGLDLWEEIKKREKMMKRN